MSSHGGPLPDVSVQKTEIDSRLNASMLGTLMIGMYTIVYLGTMYICLSRAKPPKKVVVYAISLMYILGIANFGFEWAFMRWFFVENGDTREHIFTAILVLPRWLHVLNNLFVFIMLTLADGLLIWRCFHVWGRSSRVISLPLFLLFSEFGIFIASIIILLVTRAEPTHHQALVVDRLESSGYILSAATSLAATFLIAYRINYLADTDAQSSQRKFKQIIEMLVQSVFIYSMALLVQAVAVAIPASISSTRVLGLQGYSAIILIPIAGMAPTIMVARVNLAASDIDLHQKTQRSRGTDLVFQSQATNTANDSVSQVLDSEKGAEELAIEHSTAFVRGDI